MNAIEAISAKSDGAREVLIVSKNQGFDEILVLIRDSGVGLDQSSVDEIFKPFVTSKPGGMGMAGDQCFNCESPRRPTMGSADEDEGATFEFSLPARSAVA